MIFLFFFLSAFAQEQKALWIKQFPKEPSAVYFEPNAQKIYVALPSGAESELLILDKRGEPLGEGKKIKGSVKKIFSFDSRIYFATADELVSFGTELEQRKKERDLPLYSDLNLNSKGELVTAEADGVFLWKRGGKVKISERDIKAVFFDLFEPMGVDSSGTVWNLLKGNKAGFGFSRGCFSVWKYNEYWLCISEDTVERAGKGGPVLTFPGGLRGFGFGYQKEEKDLFWLLVLKNEVRAVSPVFRK